MEVNYIFGVSRFLTDHSDTVKQGYMVDAQGLPIKTGSPCLIFSNSADKVIPATRLGTITEPRKFILAPFPTGYGLQPRCIIDTHNQNFVVKELEETDFLDRIKVIGTSSINPNKLIHAVDYVKDNGPLTFLIDEKKHLQTNLIKVVDKLCKMFKHRSLFYSGTPGKHSLVSGEKVIFTLSMMDIRQCLPIFEPDKVDGVILHGAVTYTQRSKSNDKLCTSAEFFMLFSQFKTNLGAIDGDLINTWKFTSPSELVSVIKNFSKFYTEIGKSKPKIDVKMKKPTVSKNEPKTASYATIKTGRGGVGHGYNTTYTSNTSATAYATYSASTTTWSS